MYRKKTVVLVSLSIICLMIAVIAIAAALRGKGNLKLSVVDAYTDAPLKNAVVVIPETGGVFTANAKGQISCTGVEIIPNAQLKRILETDCGEITLLCYAEGYLPFALFHAQVYDIGVGEKTLYMFPEGSENGRSFIAMIEPPRDEWISELLKEYRPNY